MPIEPLDPALHKDEKADKGVRFLSLADKAEPAPLGDLLRETQNTFGFWLATEAGKAALRNAIAEGLLPEKACLVGLLDTPLDSVAHIPLSLKMESLVTEPFSREECKIEFLHAYNWPEYVVITVSNLSAIARQETSSFFAIVVKSAD